MSLVEGGGFEPPKSFDDRFTVCSLWPLGNPSVQKADPTEPVPPPIWSWRWESNPQPAAYKAAALPLSYASVPPDFLNPCSVAHFLVPLRPRLEAMTKCHNPGPRSRRKLPNIVRRAGYTLLMVPLRRRRIKNLVSRSSYLERLLSTGINTVLLRQCQGNFIIGNRICMADIY